MAKPKTNKTIKSISFDKDVLEALEIKCLKDGFQVSTFVNMVMRKKIMSEYDYYRARAKQHNAEFQKYKFLMETAPDRPEKN